MKDEIKEILEQLEWYRKIGKKDVYYPECILPNKQAFILLDYITNLQETKINMEQELQELYLIKDNLQEELKSANESITWWTNRFNALQEENERLNIKLEKIKDIVLYYGETFDSKLHQEMQKLILDVIGIKIGQAELKEGVNNE